MDLYERAQRSKAFLVVERGAGTDANRCNGAVLECSNDGCPVEFEEAFMREWWTQRRPLVAAAASKNGPRGAAPSHAGTGGNRPTLPKVPAPAEVPWACRPLEQHSSGVMQSLTEVKIGFKMVTEATINGMLTAMGMNSINQLMGKRLRTMSSAISATMDARTVGGAQWS